MKPARGGDAAVARRRTHRLALRTQPPRLALYVRVGRVVCVDDAHQTTRVLLLAVLCCAIRVLAPPIRVEDHDRLVALHCKVGNVVEQQAASGGQIALDKRLLEPWPRVDNIVPVDKHHVELVPIDAAHIDLLVIASSRLRIALLLFPKGGARLWRGRRLFLVGLKSFN